MNGRAPSLVARGAVFCVLVAYFTIGPAFKQVLGADTPYLRSWRMYSNRFPICEVRYLRTDSAGPSSPVDRFELLEEPRATAPLALRRIENPGEAVAIAARLCSRAGDDDEIRAYVRCASLEGDGWSVEMAGEEDLCASAAGAPP